jgi:hypothetical protein
VIDQEKGTDFVNSSTHMGSESDEMGCDANLRNVAGAGGGESAVSLCWSRGHAAACEEPAEQQLPESRHVVFSVDLLPSSLLCRALATR